MNQVVVTMPIITSGELVAVTNEKKEQCKSNSPGKTVNNEAMTTSVRPELQDNNEAEANTTGVDADNDDASFNAMEDDDEYSYKYEGGDDLDRSNNMAYFDGLMISPPDAVSETYYSMSLSQQRTIEASSSSSLNAYLEMNGDDHPESSPIVSHNKVAATAAFTQMMTKEGYWKAYRTTIRKAKPSLPQILENFRSYLESSIFVETCKQEGLIEPSFAWKQPTQALAEKFLQKGLTSDEVTLGLVFHGTPPQNLESILQNGLDPDQRKGQAHGPGEYFGKSPDVSLSYCRGGDRMLVFCVVDVLPAEKSLPPGYVVVQESTLQLPLGVLSFSSASREMMHRSRMLQNELKRLSDEARKHESLAHEAKLKAKIIQLLIHGELELAAFYFKKVMGAFSQDCKKEIAFYAYQHQTDPEFVGYYFEGELPPPSECRWANLKILSVDEHEKHAEAAREKINKARKRMGTSSTYGM